jgi:ribosome-binding protein aMBF1 (putative translation factor)
MLAVVKKPRIELSIQGERAREIIDWLRKKYEVAVLSTDDDETLVPIEETEFWKEMEKNRVGNLLAGARLKAGLTQERLAGKLHIRQNMVSDYEHGRRILSSEMAKRFSAILQVREEHLKYGGAGGLPRRLRRLAMTAKAQ